MPQELATDMFETVWNTTQYSRGLFGKPRDPAFIEKVLRDLSLWDKKDSKIMTLSGGMKRRVMIAKALSHEPTILFLDEPSAGVDVELRRDMWQMVRGLRERGVTIILTTHYIEEAEEMADRIGVISKGELVVVEEKTALMRKLGKKQLTLHLQSALAAIPAALAGLPLEIVEGRHRAHLHVRYPGGRNRHRRAAAQAQRTGHRLQGPAHDGKLARGHLREPREGAPMNVHAIKAIYSFEMSRTFRTVFQSIAAPVITTSLYFVVFGSAIGSRMVSIDGVSYGAFIVPGLIMLTVLTESLNNASFGIYMPKFAGTIYEMRQRPCRRSKCSRVCRRGGDEVGDARLVILATARLFVPFEIQHPFAMFGFLVLTSVTFTCSASRSASGPTAGRRPASCR